MDNMPYCPFDYYSYRVEESEGKKGEVKNIEKGEGSSSNLSKEGIECEDVAGSAEIRYNLPNDPFGMAAVNAYFRQAMMLGSPSSYEQQKLEKMKSNNDDDVCNELPNDPFGMAAAYFRNAMMMGSSSSSETQKLDKIKCNVDDDVCNELPNDPFGMAAFNAIFNKAMMCPNESGQLEKMKRELAVDDEEIKDGLSGDDRVMSLCNMNFSFNVMGNAECSSSDNSSSHCALNVNRNGNADGPHEALMFCLGYLGLEDLLVVDSVCKSFHNAVRTDTLLWKNINIGYPLNKKITDDILLQLTNRAEGGLQGLTMLNCFSVTNDGMKRVLDKNPHLTKLNVPGCIKLRINCFMDNLKAFSSSAKPGLKHLRLAGIYGVTHKQFEELKCLVGADKCKKPKAHIPIFYHNRERMLTINDDRAIDLDICPGCQNVRPIFDCPAKECLGKATCRACAVCIFRCYNCGRCLNSEYEETFCLQKICFGCLRSRVVYQKIYFVFESME